MKGIGQTLHDLRRDASITWGYGGPSAIWEALLEQTVHRLYRRQRATLFEADVTAVREVPPPAGVEIRVLAEGDWGLLAQATTARSLQQFQDRVKTGNTCLVAWRGDQPVGRTWVSKREAPPGALPAPLPADAAYTWGLWVDPRERGRGVGSALVRARHRHTYELGMQRAWRAVADDNRPALRTIEKVSGEDVRVLGKLVYVTFLGQRRVRFEAAIR